VVTPSWHHPEVGPGDLVVVLDPGMAFGNAEHGTTRGCLRLLEHAVRPGERVMDVGTGSGVLAIAAARLGAASVDALEADPWAVAPARENVGANGVADRVRVREATADTDTLAAMGPHDGVVANIEAGVLTSLLPGFAASVRPGGWLVLSGVLGSQLEALTDAAREHGFDSLAVDIDGDWRSALLRRRAGTTPIHPTPRSGDRLQA
jgi:ribosomal protein L11 methyltransferase